MDSVNYHNIWILIMKKHDTNNDAIEIGHAIPCLEYMVACNHCGAIRILSKAPPDGTPCKDVGGTFSDNCTGWGILSVFPYRPDPPLATEGK